MFLRRDLSQTILAGVVLAVSLVIALVAFGVIAPADTGRLSRYLAPFAGLAGTERTVVRVIAIVLLVLAASTFVGPRSFLGGRGRR